MSPAEITPVVPREGWHVMHLFYHVDHAQWSLYGDDEKRQAKTRLTELVHEIRATPDTHLLVFSVTTPKADLGFMLLGPDLQMLNAFEKQISLSLGPEILSPAYSYLSQTESSEYTTTREQYSAETLIGEKGMTEGSAEFEAGLVEFDEDVGAIDKLREFLGPLPSLVALALCSQCPFAILISAAGLFCACAVHGVK